MGLAAALASNSTISWIRASFREAAVALATVVLREPVSVAQLTGVACVLGAVQLATFGQVRAERGMA
jgi:drug/metabolite transporter (DMT)-like permease